MAKAIHAWILPKPRKRHDPNSDSDVEAWTSRAEINGTVLAKSKPVALIVVPSEEEYATLHSFKLKVPENAFVYVKVDKGLDAVGGFILADDFALRQPGSSLPS